MSFVRFVSWMLVLGITSLDVVELRSFGRVDRQVLCTHAVLDQDLHPPSSLGYRQIVVQSDSDSDDEYGDNSSPAHRAFPDDGTDINDDVGEDRTDLEWRKISRYIKRQLKVPKRYLRKIVRKLTAAATLRSLDSSGEGLISLMPSSDSGDLNNILMDASGGFEQARLLVVAKPKSIEYFTVIAPPASRMYK